MEIKKEFAPITIRINTIEELNNFKIMARVALDNSTLMGSIKHHYKKHEKPDWMWLAEELRKL